MLRAEQARKEWKAHIAQLREKQGRVLKSEDLEASQSLAFLRLPNALPNGQRALLQRDRQTVPLWSAGPFLYKGVEYEETTISPNAEEIHRND